jgi:hypothetical protein
MTTPHDEAGRSRQERGVPDTGRQERRFPDTGPGTTPDPTTPDPTSPGLVVTEERLADGRRITYYGLSR